MGKLIRSLKQITASCAIFLLDVHGHFHFQPLLTQLIQSQGQNLILSTSNSNDYRIMILENMAVEVQWRSVLSNLTCFHTGYKAIFLRVMWIMRWLLHIDYYQFSTALEKSFIWPLQLNGGQYVLGHVHLSITQHERSDEGTESRITQVFFLLWMC